MEWPVIRGSVVTIRSTPISWREGRYRVPMLRARAIAQAARTLILFAVCAARHTAPLPMSPLVALVPAALKNAQSTDGNNAVCVSSTWKYPAYTFQSVAASAGASCSGTAAGTMRYNTTLTRLEICDGTIWSALIKSIQTSSGTAPRAAAILS